MHVVGIKANKIAYTKVVLILSFISPPSLNNVQMPQMLCTRLEANTKQGLATMTPADPTLGYILMMTGGPTSWKRQRQENVSLSTSEAEFVASSQAGQEAIYLSET